MAHNRTKPGPKPQLQRLGYVAAATNIPVDTLRRMFQRGEVRGEIDARGLYFIVESEITRLRNFRTRGVA